MRKLRAAVVIAAGALLVAACGGDNKSSSSSTTAAGGGGSASTSAGGGAATTVNLTQGGNVNIEVVTHGQASDPFWSVVKNGLEKAAKDVGAKVNYNAPDTYDMVKMSQLIDAAVAKKPQGLIVSMPDYDALKGSLLKAKDAGIPIITINSGSDHYKDVGAITHIGQDETIAGQAAGQRLVDAGAKNVLCVIQEVGNAGLDARCNGAKQSIEKAGAKIQNIQTDLKDAAGSQNTIKSKLQSDSSIDAVLALGPTGALPALGALKDLGQTGKMKLATFDLNPAVLDAITAGDMLFAVDQQQYLQGYLAVVAMNLFVTNLNTVGGGLPVLTGPGFVTKDNAAKVKSLSAAGTR
jgi:simple sugar transport system substrate-binding protein